MKKLLFSILLFALPLCSENDLSLKFQEGQSKSYNALIDLRLTQSLPDSCDMQYRFYAKFLLSHVVKKVLESGNVEIEASIKDPAIIISMKCPMEGSPFDFTYDSTESSKELTGDALPFKELKEALNNATYTLSVSPKGKILEVNGLQPIREQVEKKALAATPMVAQGIMAIVSEQAAEIIHEPLFTHIPEKPVAVGETWVQTGRPPLERKLTLVSADESKIEVKEELTLKLDIPPSEMTLMTLNLEGAINGTLTIDPKTGWPISNKASGGFAGKQTLTTPLLDKPLEIPLKIDVVTDYQYVAPQLN